MSPSDTSQALYDKERHKGDWKGKKEIEGGIEREIETEHPLCVYSCVNQQGLWRQQKTHACDRVLLNNKEYLCPCGSGLSGCEMKITPHTGLIYFNQIWPKPDKCWILNSTSLLINSLCPPSIPASWIKLSCVTRPSSSQPSMEEKSFSPPKTIKVTFALCHVRSCSSETLQEVASLSALHNAYPQPWAPFSWHFPQNECLRSQWICCFIHFSFWFYIFNTCSTDLNFI